MFKSRLSSGLFLFKYKNYLQGHGIKSHTVRHIGTCHRSLLIDGMEDAKEGEWDKWNAEYRKKIQKIIGEQQKEFIHGMFIGTILVPIREIKFREKSKCKSGIEKKVGFDAIQI